MKVYVTGAAVVRNDMYATIQSGSVNKELDALFRLPYLEKIFAKKSSRFGRFDRYTRTGCAAAGLALCDAGREPGELHNTGFILAGQYGSFVTDMDFYKTTLQGGQFASPNLFSYTLPNIVIGECAMQFGLTGPTFCLDSEGGRAGAALYEAASLLLENTMEAMLVGWLEVLPVGAPQEDEGAAVLVLEKKKKDNNTFQLELETNCPNGIRFSGGESIGSIDELLKALNIVEIGIKN